MPDPSQFTSTPCSNIKSITKSNLNNSIFELSWFYSSLFALLHFTIALLLKFHIYSIQNHYQLHAPFQTRFQIKYRSMKGRLFPANPPNRFQIVARGYCPEAVEGS